MVPPVPPCAPVDSEPPEAPTAFEPAVEAEPAVAPPTLGTPAAPTSGAPASPVAPPEVAGAPASPVVGAPAAPEPMQASLSIGVNEQPFAVSQLSVVHASESSHTLA